MHKYKVKLFYFPKTDIVLERKQLADFKKNNTVLRVKHIKTSGGEEKVLKVFYISKEKDSHKVGA